MVFSSSQKLEFDVIFVSVLHNLDPAVGAFKGISLAGCFFLRTVLYIISVKGK